jgi:stage V sporulation protein B
LSKLLSNSITSILNNFIQLIVSLGSGFLIARILGTEGKGEVYLLTQFSSFIQVIFLFGLGVSLLYFLKTKVITYNQSVTFSVFFNIVVVAILLLLIVVYPNILSEILGKEININKILITIITAQLNIFCGFIGYIEMYKENGVKNWSIISLLSNVIYLLFLFFLIYTKPFGVEGALLALLFSTIIKAAFLCIPTLIRFVFETLKLAIIGQIFAYGFGAFISNLFLTSVFRIDVFFLNNYVSLSEIGLYSVSVNVGELLLLVPNALGLVLFPHLSGLEGQELLNTMSKIGRLSFILGLIGCVGLMFFGYPFILIIFGSKFTKAFVPLLLLLPGLMAMTLNYSYSNFFTSTGQSYVPAKCFGLGLAVNLLSNLIFIPKFGIIAAAVTSSITYIIITLCFVFIIRKKHKLDYGVYVFPSKNDFMYLLNKTKGFVKLNKS